MATGSISFNTILTGIRTNTHHIEVDSSRAVQGRNVRRHVILAIGINLASGTVVELEPIAVASGAEADGFFGTGSMLAEMVHAAKAANSDTEMVAIGVDELSGGTAGTTTATFVGTITTAGTIHMYVNGIYIPVAVLVGDDATAQALAAKTAFDAHESFARQPFAVAVTAGVATFTMRWKGEDQGDIRFNYNESDAFPAGVTSVTVAEAVAGVGNSDIGEVITAIGDEWYDTFLMPFTDNTNQALLDTELDRRFGGMVQIEGVAFSGFRGTAGETTTEGNARNNKHTVIMGSNESPTAPWIWGAVVGAVDAFEPDPARPRQTLALPGLLPAAKTSIWTQAQRNTLLFDGIATHVVDASGKITIERLVTTYQTNAQGVPDTAFLDVTTLRTLAAIRFDRSGAISLRFPRHKLMDDGDDIPVGQPIVTPNTIRAHGIAQFQRWQAAGWVEDFEQFVDEYIVFIDDADPNRIVEQMGPNLMNQFRGLSSQIQFLL